MATENTAHVTKKHPLIWSFVEHRPLDVSDKDMLPLGFPEQTDSHPD